MYSQNQEEQVILNYFGEKKGHLLDLGANDGMTFSNSLRLIQLGWSADLVEPSPGTYEKLCELHKNNEEVKCHEVAISSVNGTVEFHESGTLLGSDDKSLVSTLDPKEKQRWGGKVAYKKISVESVTFNSLLERTKKRTFDFITIDVEGLDWLVLNQINLKEVGCKMLIIETNGKETLKYVKYCNQFGLSLLSSNQENIIMTL